MDIQFVFPCCMCRRDMSEIEMNESGHHIVKQDKDWYFCYRCVEELMHRFLDDYNLE